jgi:hypothetical protein
MRGQIGKNLDYIFIKTAAKKPGKKNLLPGFPIIN